MATPDSPRRKGEVPSKPLPQRSLIQLDPYQSDQEREATIIAWLTEILGETVDD